MLTQLFKIMWRRKGSNFLLLTEIFFSFLVLFATGTLITEGLINYFSPQGFDHTDVYDVRINRQGEGNPESFPKMQQIDQVLKGFPEISNYSFTDVNTPFSFNIMDGSIGTEEQQVRSYNYRVEPAYLETLDLEMAEGSWFQKGDVRIPKPVVINEHLRDKLFPGESALGKRIKSDGGTEYQVTGVVKHFRQDGNLTAPESSYFVMYNDKDTADIAGNILLEIKAGAHPAWQQNLIDQLQEIGGSWSIDLVPLTEARASKAKIKVIPAIALAVVCGFLIFNVALGLFGVLYYNINKRYSEIGIRRALGATATAVRRQMLGEVLVMATLGVSLGVLLALQFPLLGVMNVETYIYLIANAAALLLIYLLVALCAWFPSKQAAQIEPAIALHYD
ncbi:ABC transporter permease [Cesiribacter sp. SM1]|uniref:ABC transporter permease n=1 Tax=Cesiribacter sp. SM1 TaxID=2861196 RepID=UPI001CD33B18|nr:ABC transporter permease [Cesiribacter sp. SM1]